MTRLRRPMAQRSSKRPWDAWKERNRLEVGRRAHGVCEGCNREDRPLEGDHLFGRGNQLAEPWTSWHPLMAGLCTASIFEDDPGCHTRRHEHVDPDLATLLGWKAFERLCEAVDQLDAVAWGRRVYDKPLHAIRQLIANLEEAGWHWSLEQGRIVNANEEAA